MSTQWGPDSPHKDCAHRDHGHDITTLVDIATKAQADELARKTELVELSAGSAHTQISQLEARVRELETDRAAIIRRMRLIEEALQLTPPAAALTTQDPPPSVVVPRLGDRLPLDTTDKGPHGIIGRLPVELDELDDLDPKEP